MGEKFGEVGEREVSRRVGEKLMPALGLAVSEPWRRWPARLSKGVVVRIVEQACEVARRKGRGRVQRARGYG